MTGYWTQFAKTGDLNGPRLPPSPVYDRKGDLVLEIGMRYSSDCLTHWPIRCLRVPPQQQARIDAVFAQNTAWRNFAQMNASCWKILAMSTTTPSSSPKQSITTSAR